MCRIINLIIPWSVIIYSGTDSIASEPAGGGGGKGWVVTEICEKGVGTSKTKYINTCSYIVYI